MNNKLLAIAFTAGTVCFACRLAAEDLTVARGETYDLPADATYGTVTVSGTLNIPAGLTLTADTLELGPDEGDAAVVNVLGSSKAGLKVTSTVNVGSNGGSGQIVALSPDATHNTGYDTLAVVDFHKLYIREKAAVSSSGFVDFLKLGRGTADFRTMYNESGAPARVLVSNGCLGFTQHWGYSMFVGHFQVESFDGGDIRFGCNYGERTLNYSGTFTVKGNGRDVYFCRYTDAATQFFYIKSGIVWDSVRDIILVERHPVKLGADDLMPYGPSAGIFRLETIDPASLDIVGTVQHLNSFSTTKSVSANAALTGSVGGKVIFGEGDTDGFLKGRIHENVGVFKVGTGVFSITNEAKVGTMTVSNGTLKVAAPFDIEKLTVAADATLEIDGVTLAPSSGQAVVSGQLVLKNGGRLVTSLSASEDVRVAGYANAGEWEKNGEGTLIVEDPLAMPSDVHVKAGTLAFAAEGYACDLFKWTVTAWNNVGYFNTEQGARHNMFYLGELALIDPAGLRIGIKSIKSMAIGTPPGDLAPGTAAFASGTVLMAAGGSGNVGSLFDTNQWPRVGVDSPLVTDEGGVTLYVRLPAGSPAVSAMNFAAAYGGFPKSWTLSGSADGGQTWHKLNSVTDYVVPVPDNTSEVWMGADSKNIIGLEVPKTFLLHSDDLAFAPTGVKNMPAAMRVCVDAGAVLDFTNVTGGQTVEALTVDASGGGTIRNARFAESGTIFVTGVAEEALGGELAIALSLEECAALGNLAAWTVSVNGVELSAGDYRIKYRNGKLTFSRRGLTILLK